MKRFAVVLGCAAAGATLCLSGKPAFAGNLAINGSFDNFDLTEGRRGDKTNWNYFSGQYLDNNKTELGWQTTTGGTLEIRQDGVAGRAHNGSSHFAELDAHNYKGKVGADEDLGIFQDIVTQVGKKYRFEFAYAARPNIDGDRNKFEALFGSAFSQQFDGGNGKTEEGRAWKTFSTDVVATDEITRFQFNYLGSRDTLGAHIDSVSVEQVPEPASLLGLAFMGLFGVGAMSKRKQPIAE